MCQYSGRDGFADDWHLVHYGALASGGAGIVFTEAVAVLPEGRITPHDLGAWDDAQVDMLSRIAGFVAGQGAVPGVQLAHAGRKAGMRRPWDPGPTPVPEGEGGWPGNVWAPSAVPFSDAYPLPRALDADGIRRVVRSFRDAAGCALDAGFRILEVHAAHGYLLHEFLSPLANRRDDEYGGSFDHRIRFPLAAFDAVRAAWPADKPLGVRVSATDWVDGGWTLEETIDLARRLEAGGADWIDVSSGGVSPKQKIVLGPGYQVPFARAIRRATGVTTMAVGLITDARQADEIIAAGDADMVALARALLWDPRWPWHAAAALGGTVNGPQPYWRGLPKEAATVFGDARIRQR